MMAHDVLRDVLSDVKQSREFSIIVDETTDVQGMEQVAICLRYVDSNLNPDEVFTGLYQVTSTTGENLSNVIMDSLQRYSLSVEDLRGQCYDGASNMKGKHNGVQAVISKKQPLAIYVHCFNHSLNLALQDTAKSVGLAGDTLAWLNNVGVLIGESAKRKAEFSTICIDRESIVVLRDLCVRQGGLYE